LKIQFPLELAAEYTKSKDHSTMLKTNGRKSSNLVKSCELIWHFIKEYLVPLLPYLKAGAVIGYDARHNSNRWAKLTARVFLKAGFKVYLFDSITPTPFVPYTVQNAKAAIGIMITASHNPKEDNGYKVFWSNGNFSLINWFPFPVQSKILSRTCAT
jgi:phosphoglucomutase